MNDEKQGKDNLAAFKEGYGQKRIAEELVRASERCGASIESLQILFTPQGQEIWDAIGKLIVKDEKQGKDNLAAFKEGYGQKRIAEELVRASERCGASIESLQILFTPKGQEIWEAIGKLIVNGHPNRAKTPVDKGRLLVVSALSAIQLTARVKARRMLTYLDSNYRCWDYWVGLDDREISGRGKTFEWRTWAPGHWQHSPDDVRQYFLDLGGFYGHAGAFTAWVEAHGTLGLHVTVPIDNGCWRLHHYLYMPYSEFRENKFRENDRELGLKQFDGTRQNYTVYVGFREL